MHEGQLDISVQTVRGLIDAQFPQWRQLPVRQLPLSGTVNALFRLGPALVIRLPLVAADPESARAWLAREAAAARELLGRTRYPTPAPIALGEPGLGYPMPWSVQTWLPGTTAADDDPGDSDLFAHDLADLIADLRAIDVRGRTFSGGGRGGSLPTSDGWMQECLTRSDALLEVPPLRRLWSAFRKLPRSDPDALTHGDLIPGNVLVAHDRLAGILDVGGFGPADPALDLVAAWHLLESGPRQLLRDDLGCDDLQWARGAAWAFEQAMGAVWYYTDSNPAMAAMGRRTLHRIVAEPPTLPGAVRSPAVEAAIPAASPVVLQDRSCPSSS